MIFCLLKIICLEGDTQFSWIANETVGRAELGLIFLYQKFSLFSFYYFFYLFMGLCVGVGVSLRVSECYVCGGPWIS